MSLKITLVEILKDLKEIKTKKLLIIKVTSLHINLKLPQIKSEFMEMQTQ